MEIIVNLAPETETSNEVLENESHNVSARVDSDNEDIYLECSSRETLYELGKALMLEALHGSGQMELYPLELEGKCLVVDGARLTKESSRIFIFSPPKSQ
jgi:hypothetical protein